MAEQPNFFTDGAAYERLMGRWSVLAGADFLDWLDQPAGLRWLDVGCGNGAFTELLAGRCAPAEVHGLDQSEGQLAFARTRPGASIAQFRQGDAQALPYDDHSFDAVAMALVIGFIPDPAKAVAEMARVARPGGWVATYMWDMPNAGIPLAPLIAALRSMGIDLPKPPGAAASGRDSMQALWRQAGLEAIDSRQIRIPVAYAGFDDFWESSTLPIGPSGKVIEAMPTSAREKLKATLRAQLPIDAQGRIAYESVANAVKGRVPGG